MYTSQYTLYTIYYSTYLNKIKKKKSKKFQTILRFFYAISYKQIFHVFVGATFRLRLKHFIRMLRGLKPAATIRTINIFNLSTACWTLQLKEIESLFFNQKASLPPGEFEGFRGYRVYHF